MTADEAALVMGVCNMADSECCSCAADLRDMLGDTFPEHRAIFERVYRARYEPEDD